MNLNELKVWIEENYYRIDGIPNSNFARESFCKKNDLYLMFHQSVLRETEWLNEYSPKFNDRVKAIISNIKHAPICKHCGSKVKLNWDRSSDSLFNSFCSIKCSRSHEDTKKKQRSTCIDKYGVDNPSKSDCVKDKIKSANRIPFDEAVERFKKHYGYKFEYSKHKEFESDGSVEVYCKIHDETFIRGASSLLRGETNCPSCRADALRNQYTMTVDQFKQRLHDVRGDEFTLNGDYCGMHSISSFKCKNGHTFECKPDHIVGTNLGNCPYCYTGSSKEEESFISFIRSVSDNPVIANSRKHLGNGKEIDVVVGNIMFEYNGLYWHSDRVVNKTFHLSKTTKAESLGYRLFHVWSHEWTNPSKRLIWESIIKNALHKPEIKIMARKCEVKELDSKEYIKFMDENHIQGYSHSTIKLGLFFEGELVSAMGFSVPRFTPQYDYELVRFANKKNCSIVGAASKLLSRFRKLYPDKSIVSYADRRLSLGNVYQKLGFTMTHYSKPSYFYTKDGINTVSRYSAQRKNLPKLLKSFDPSLSETKNMNNNGYYKVYDCGTSVWVLK